MESNQNTGPDGPVTAADDRRVQWARELASEPRDTAEMNRQQLLQLLARYQDLMRKLLDVIQDYIDTEIAAAETEAAPADEALKAALLAALPGEHTPADIAVAEFLATYSWAEDSGRVVLRWLRKVARGRLRELEAEEDRLDAADAAEARNQPGESIPLEDIEAELGGES
jgi:hypothetical protein